MGGYFALPDKGVLDFLEEYRALCEKHGYCINNGEVVETKDPPVAIWFMVDQDDAYMWTAAPFLGMGTSPRKAEHDYRWCFTVKDGWNLLEPLDRAYSYGKEMRDPNPTKRITE